MLRATIVYVVFGAPLCFLSLVVENPLKAWFFMQGLARLETRSLLLDLGAAPIQDVPFQRLRFVANLLLCIFSLFSFVEPANQTLRLFELCGLLGVFTMLAPLIELASQSVVVVF